MKQCKISSVEEESIKKKLYVYKCTAMVMFSLTVILLIAFFTLFLTYDHRLVKIITPKIIHHDGSEKQQLTTSANL